MKVVEYDPEWPARFEAERTALENVLAPWLSAGVQHIGSTAVPGLAAKPIIDMLAGVHSLDASRAAFPALEELGYVYRPHRAEAHLFLRQDECGVHLTEPGSALWTERLAFRDALRGDPALCEEYAAWKAAHFVGGDRWYDADKRPLVQRVLGNHGIDLKPDAERLDSEALRARRPQATTASSTTDMSKRDTTGV